MSQSAKRGRGHAPARLALRIQSRDPNHPIPLRVIEGLNREKCDVEILQEQVAEIVAQAVRNLCPLSFDRRGRRREREHVKRFARSSAKDFDPERLNPSHLGCRQAQIDADELFLVWSQVKNAEFKVDRDRPRGQVEFGRGESAAVSIDKSQASGTA